MSAVSTVRGSLCLCLGAWGTRTRTVQGREYSVTFLYLALYIEKINRVVRCVNIIFVAMLRDIVFYDY